MSTSSRATISRPSYYQLSGHFEWTGILVTSVVASTLAALLAGIYAYGILYMPILYGNLLLAGGFGFGMGLGTGLLLRMQKVRNVVVANVMVGAVALFGLYVAWAVWTFAVLHRFEVPQAALLPILLNPLKLAHLISVINENGVWTIKRYTPTGFMLAVFWLAEGVLVFVAAGLAGVSSAASGVFCEDCNEWCDETEGVARLSAQTPSYLKRRLEERDFQFLAKLGPPAASATDFFRLNLHSCPRCDATHALVVDHVQVTTDKNGKPQEDTTTLVDKLLVSAAENRWLRAFGEGRAELPSLLDKPPAETAPAPLVTAAPAPRPAPRPMALSTAPGVDAAEVEARRRRLESLATTRQAASVSGVGHTLLRQPSVVRSTPKDASQALRFAAFRAQPSEAGLRTTDKAGLPRDMEWTAVREIVVHQLPNDPPWSSAIVIDFVPADGSAPMRLVTGSFIDWKALPGQATPSPAENVRRLCRYALERHPSIALDEATRRFVEGAPCRRLLGMEPFNQYDARYA